MIKIIDLKNVLSKNYKTLSNHPTLLRYTLRPLKNHIKPPQTSSNSNLALLNKKL